MIANKSILGVIPARGGSIGIPRKNITLLSGKPLIVWTIEETSISKYIDRLIVSTDDDEIIDIVQDINCEVPFKRPSELAQDITSSIDVALHAIDQCPGYDILVYLQPTSPLRTVSDVDKCIEKLIRSKSNSCVSMCEPNESPYLLYNIDDGNKLQPVFPEEAKTINKYRQACPVYMLNGAVFVAFIDWLKEYELFIGSDTVPYIMPPERSIDIDTPLDLVTAEILLTNRKSTSG